MAGIIVDHKESGVRYAISESNYRPEVHKKVRELKPGETVLGYQPRAKEELGRSRTTDTTTTTAAKAAEDKK